MRPAATAQPCCPETNSIADSGGTVTVPAADAGLRHAPVGLSEDAAEPAPLCPDGADPHPPASRVIPPSAAARQHLPAADISLCITIPTTPRLSAWLDCPISSYPSEFKDPRARGRPDRSHPRPDGSGSGGQGAGQGGV